MEYSMFKLVIIASEVLKRTYYSTIINNFDTCLGKCDDHVVQAYTTELDNGKPVHV